MKKPCLDDSCDARGHCGVCGGHMLGSWPEYGAGSCPSVCDSCDGLPDDEVERIRAEVASARARKLGEEFPKTELHAVTRMGIFDIQVCSRASEADALAWIQNAYPAGTSRNWTKSDDERHKPVACQDGDGRTHYVFVA